MRLSKNEILRLPLDGQDFELSLNYESKDIPEYMGIRHLDPVSVKGKLSYDAHSEHLLVNVSLKGRMILPCSITFRDVPIQFKSTTTLVFGFKADESPDIIALSKDEIDLNPEFLSLIWMEVPAQVIAKDIKEFPHGDNWEVLSETEYNRRKTQKPDERLAKILEYKPNNE